MILELHRAVSTITTAKPEEVVASPADQAKIDIEQGTLLLRGVPVALVAVVVNALITLIVGWSLVNPVILTGWTLAIVALSIVRLGMWMSVRRQKSSPARILAFKRQNMIAMAINGALWGMLAPIFAVYGQIGHVYLPFILAGMTAAAIVSAGASWKSVVAFNIPALLPMAGAFFLWGGEGAALISFVIILYGALTLYLAVQTNRMINRALWLRTRNYRLQTALEEKIEEQIIAAKRFRAIVESSRELTLIFSPEGKITYASPASEALLERTPESLIGATTRDLVHEDDLAQFQLIGGKTLSLIGEVQQIPHLCMKDGVGGFRAMSGRLANMLYVPGVEGFVFSGIRQDNEIAARIHAAQ